MIRLGFNSVALYPNTGIHIQIAGGEFHILGSYNIGNNSFIAVGKHGKLILGDNFRATSSIKIACQHEITFESNVLCGWETIFVDSDFHRYKNADGTERTTKPYGPIHVGEECWLGFKSVVMKNNVIPRCCVVSSNSIVLKSNDIKEYSLLAGQPAKVIKSGVYRDYRDDVIEYN